MIESSETDSVGPARSAEDLTQPEREQRERTIGPPSLVQPQRTNDPVQLREKALSDRQQQLQEENDLRVVLATEEGVRFAARLISACGWNLPHFNPSNSVMCEIAGRRSIAWQIEGWISDVELKLWFAVRAELERARPRPEGPKSKLERGAIARSSRK